MRKKKRLEFVSSAEFAQEVIKVKDIFLLILHQNIFYMGTYLNPLSTEAIPEITFGAKVTIIF